MKKNNSSSTTTAALNSTVILNDPENLSYSVSPIDINAWNTTWSNTTTSLNWDIDASKNYKSSISIPEDGDIKIGNLSLKNFIENVENRLAILQPNPELLEKYEALRQAYEHYRTLEALCTGDPPKDPNRG